ncbi:hypothetical protein BJ742DRAFT_857818 [Cladochytrium replicatum]|nr:hypothetical protein BJ742DRAFT_857818 [Cladochytrium replicatum]
MDTTTTERLLASALSDVREALSLTGAQYSQNQPNIPDTLSNDSSGGAYRPSKTFSISACDRCYSRKIRCPSNGFNEPCRTCVSARAVCTYGLPQYRTRTRRKAPPKQKEASEGVTVEGNGSAIQNMEYSNPAGVASNSNFTADVFDLLQAQLATGGRIDELKSGLGLDSIFKFNGVIPLPNSGNPYIPNSASISDNVGSIPYFAPTPQLGGGLMGEVTWVHPFSSLIFPDQNSLDFSSVYSASSSPFATDFGQVPPLRSFTPILHTPTPVVEPPHYLLSHRQKEELVDAYFNFINPMLVFFHPGHFWNEFRARRIPEFLLDAIFGVSVTFVNPRVKVPDSFGTSIFSLSYQEAEQSSSMSTPSSTQSSSTTPNESERSWTDVGYEEFALLSKHLKDRALEWAPKLIELRPSLSVVHALIILGTMEMGSTRYRVNLQYFMECIIRLATYMSLNVDIPGKAFENNVRRRTWWCLLLIEANMAFRYGTKSNLPPSYTPSYPDVQPNNGSATGPWSPEATLACIANADIGKIMVQELRVVHSGLGSFTNARGQKFLDILREWEARHAPILSPPPHSSTVLLNQQDICACIQSTSAKITKNAAVIICLQPAALAFQLGGEEEQDWSPHIRHSLAKKFHPSYSAWIEAQNAARAITEILEMTPYKVLSRMPFLDIFVFPAVALSFQTLLHTSDTSISRESAKMLSKLCSSLVTANPWGKGMMYSRVTDFCLKFARLYLEHHKGTISFAPILEKRNQLPFAQGTLAADQLPPKLQQVEDQDTVSPQQAEAEEVSASNGYECEGLFMEPSLTELSTPSKLLNEATTSNEITVWDFKEVQITLMESIPEIKTFIFKHLDV